MFPIIEEQNKEEYSDFSHLSIVPDHLNRYPGEVIQFFIKLEYKKEYNKSILSVALPKGLELIDYTTSEGDLKDIYVRDHASSQIVNWHLGKVFHEGQDIELVVRAIVMNHGRLVYLVTVADLLNTNGDLVESANIRIAVHPKGNYLKHLPEIYHNQEFIGRFLMLFESFWKPINQQINQLDLYFDPSFTPSDFLPWLGSWLGVVWDNTLPDDRKRKLLQVAVRMYQRRGTKSSLEDYLKIYSNGHVEIIEHRSQNLLLGNEAKLGRAIALGTQNLPHTFTVNVKIDEQELERMDARDSSRNEKAYIQKLEQIIEERKPAHTAFKLNLEIDNSKNDEKLEGRDA